MLVWPVLVVTALCMLFTVTLVGLKEWPIVAGLGLTIEQAAFWELILKVFAGAVAAIGAWVTIQRYFNDRRKDQHSAMTTAVAPLAAKRQEVYSQLVSTTAKICNGPRNSRARRDAEIDFWRLYWGLVPLAADDQVSDAVDTFADALYPNADARKQSDDNHDVLMRNASMNLARACRDSLGFVGPSVVPVPWSNAARTIGSPVMFRPPSGLFDDG